MNTATDEQKQKQIAAICDCLNKHDSVQFAYLYSPLEGSGFESEADLDLAIQITPCFSDEECFEIQRSLLNHLSFALNTDKIFLVVCNRCNREYQYLVYRTGELVFNRNDTILQHFIESFKWAHHFEEYVASYKSRKEKNKQVMLEKLGKQ